MGIDHIDELINWSKENVRKDNAALLDSGRIKFIVGDGRKGHPADAPYNAIHVGAAAPTLPQEVKSKTNNPLFQSNIIVLKKTLLKVYSCVTLLCIFS